MRWIDLGLNYVVRWFRCYYGGSWGYVLLLGLYVLVDGWLMGWLLGMRG